MQATETNNTFLVNRYLTPSDVQNWNNTDFKYKDFKIITEKVEKQFNRMEGKPILFTYFIADEEVLKIEFEDVLENDVFRDTKKKFYAKELESEKWILVKENQKGLSHSEAIQVLSKRGESIIAEMQYQARVTDDKLVAMGQTAFIKNLVAEILIFASGEIEAWKKTRCYKQLFKKLETIKSPYKEQLKAPTERAMLQLKGYEKETLLDYLKVFFNPNHTL